MSGGSSEAKTEKATEQKLRRERRRGRALTAPVTVKALAIVAILIAVAALIKRTSDEFSLLFDSALEAGGAADVERIRDVTTIFGRVVAGSAFILLGIASCMAIIAATVIKRGFVFSAENISPKFQRLNPASNLKNIFGKRALTEFGLAFMEVLVWLAAAAVLIMSYTPSLIAAFSLDVPTIMRLFILIFASFLILAVLFLILTAGIDLPVQRYLFAQDMRMTRSEVRRENKDSYGDQNILAERRRLAKAALEKPIGIRKTNLVVIGSKGAVGIHFIHEQTDLPALSLRTDQSGVAGLKATARHMGIPIVEHDKFVRMIESGVDIGDEVKDEEALNCFIEVYVATLTN